MELILHFSVHCANIRVFCETTKFLEEFLLHILISRRSRKVYHQYSVLTIYQWVRHISIFSFKLAFVSSVTTVSNDPVSNGGSILVVIINFSTPLSPSCEEGSLTHSQALALSKRARDVTAPPVALNRCAIRLAGHQSPRQNCFSGDEPAGVNTYKMVVRDGTDLL